ncbi:MAG: hypothetical protein GX445_04960, partial [Elusimicrobia bacterium]|nr:hypothetical protein [Elusimicrobiota bacterium]
MVRRIYLYISIVFTILFLTGINKLWSAPDKTIVYQGTLRKDGKVITGNVNMEFNIVDGSGNEYWTSGSTEVYVNRGLFRYQIGIDNKSQFDTIPWGDITPYIRVKITDDVVGNITFPDEGFSWTPYAMYADNIVGGALLNSTQTFTGINTFNNLVNITGDLNVGNIVISSGGYITLDKLDTAPSVSKGRLYFDSAGALKISLDGTDYVSVSTSTIASIVSDSQQFTGDGSQSSPLRLKTSSVTLQGNIFNGADQLVKLDSTGKLPAVDGSLLTNIKASDLNENIIYSTHILDGQIKDADVSLSTAAIISGKFDDSRINITTGAISSGKFGDNLILITTGAISGGIFGDDRIAVSTGAIVSGKFSDDRIAISTEAITSGKFNDNRISITTGAITSGRFGDDRIFITTRAISGQWETDSIKDEAVTDSKIGWMSASKLTGTIANTSLDNSSVTLQGNEFNVANKLVKLDSGGKLPAVDGSQLQNIGAAGISDNSITSAKIADDSIMDIDINSAASITYSKLSISDGDLTISKTSGLQGQLDLISTSTNNLQGQITTLNTSTTTLRTDLTEEINTRALQVSALADSTTTIANNLLTSTTTLQTQINTLSNSTTTLQSQVNTLSGSTDTLQSQVNTLSNSTETLHGQIDTLSNSTTALQDHISELDVSTTDLKSELTTLSNSTTTLRTDLTEEVNTRTSQVSALADSITTIASNLATEITNRTSADSGLQTRIDNLDTS